MQLTTQGKNIRQALMTASTALLGSLTVASAVQAAEPVDTSWKVDSALLLYKENEGRVQAAEPVVSLKKDLDEDHSLTVKLVADSLTGASPNGAARAGKVQTFTGPSGSAQYSAQPGKLPLDNQFKDTRAAVTVAYVRPAGENARMTLGGNISGEYDFQSVALNGAYARDINGKNTTLSAGLNVEFDNIDAVGGAPEPLSVVWQSKKNGGDTKTLAEVLLGVTQVVNRNLLFQVNYSLASGSGYQSDPYKMVTLLDGANNLIADPSGAANRYGYLYESRPDAHTRHGLFGVMKYHTGGGQVVEGSYRFTTDDWGISSHTLDAKYYLPLGGNGWYVEPHLRFYTQTAADFYTPWLKQGTDFTLAGATVTPLVTHASADPRLAAMDATTIGFRVGKRMGRDSDLSLRLEQYEQQGTGVNAPATGDLAGVDQNPALKAMIVQVGYSFRW